MSPSLGIGIGMGYLPSAGSAAGTPIEIDVRGRTLPATIAKKPLYVKETNA
jgi:aminomethyltransferase